MEQQVVSGISQSKDEAKITLLGVADRPGIAASIFGPLADAEINVDMIVQNVSEDGKTTDLTFTVGELDRENAVKVLEKHKSKVGIGEKFKDRFGDAARGLWAQRSDLVDETGQKVILFKDEDSVHIVQLNT